MGEMMGKTQGDTQGRARSGQWAVGSGRQWQDSQVMEELRASRQQTEGRIFKSEMENRSAGGVVVGEMVKAGDPGRGLAVVMV